MLIQKTFHLQMDRETAKAKLSDLHGYRREFVGVETAEFGDDALAHFRFRLPWGFRGRVDLAEVPGDSPSQTLFRSRGGNMEVLGVLEYFEIKPGLTEVVLTVDYVIATPVFRLIDYLTGSMDHFLNRQLACLEDHFTRPLSGIRADRNLPEPINGHRPYPEPG